MHTTQPEPSVTPIANAVASLGVGNEFFWVPDRLVPFEHWVGHIPFAFWLVKALAPRRIVELGTHRGNSYCAMCQAVSTLGLSTEALAVDTWEGDAHMGQEEGILSELQAYHDNRYGGFSTLLQTTFDEARGTIEAGSVDLLHIDGCHTYEAVRHDFETWKSALSPRGVIIFHDTCVRRDSFGVWRLWQELSTQYPTFEFRHSYGLGVLGVGAEQAPLMQALFGLAKDEALAHQVRSIFAARGEAHLHRLRADEAERRVLVGQAALQGAEEREAAAREAAAHEASAREAVAREAAAREAAARETELRQALEADREAAQELSRLRETALRGTIEAERSAAYRALLAAQSAEAAAGAAAGDQVRLQVIETSRSYSAHGRDSLAGVA